MQPDLLGVQPLYWIWGIKKKVFQLSFLSTGSMKTFSFVSFFSLAFALCPGSSDPVFIRRNEANRVLRIQKRSNQFLEEIKSGNLERECYEETCSFEEAREIFKAQEKTTEFWFHYKDLNPCKQNPCRNGGLCQQYHYNYVCLCPPRFTGKLCDTEKLECWYNNGGCLQYCQDDDQSQDVTCSCAEGYALDENGKTCSASVVFPCGLAKSSTRSLQDDDMPLLQDDSTQPLQDDSMPSQQDDPTHTPQDDPTHSLTNNSSESVLQDPTHSLQDNCTNSLQNKSTCSPKDNSTNSVQEVSMHSLDEEFMSNDTENPTGFPLTNSSFSTSNESTSFLLDNSTKTLLDNSTLLTTNSTTNASLLDLSSKNDNVQDEVRAKLLDGNLSEDNGDESVSFKESLEDNSTRIVGGTRCHLGNCPWQVLIRTFKGQDFCGGTLISSRWVVSASHCFEDVNPHHVTIGDYDKFRRDQDEQKIAVLKVYMHPHYNGNYYDNDIALLYLRSEVQFNDFAIPVCLPNPNLARMLLQEGETGVVSGWGATRFMGPSSRFLLRVTLPVVSQKKCMHSTQQVITGNMFCAGYNVEARDSCKGDSGGPFVMSYRNTWYLMGVISWGEGCAEEDKYGVYTRVSDYIHWIKQTVEGVSETDDLPRKTRRARE